jgi:hypothetical protein
MMLLLLWLGEVKFGYLFLRKVGGMRRKTLKPVKKKRKKCRNPAGKPLKDYTQFFSWDTHKNS